MRKWKFVWLEVWPLLWMTCWIVIANGRNGWNRNDASFFWPRTGRSLPVGILKTCRRGYRAYHRIAKNQSAANTHGHHAHGVRGV